MWGLSLTSYVVTVANRVRGRFTPFYTRGSLFALIAFAAIATGVAVELISPANRPLLYPALGVLWLALTFVGIVWRRDRRLPVFEIGTLFVASTAVYAVVPLIGFMAMQGRWTTWTDNRLLFYEFNARELGSFGWRNAVYLLAFIMTYLIVRKRYCAGSTPVASVPPQLITSLGIIIVGQYAFKWFMSHFYGVDLDVSYADLSQVAQAVSQTPLLLLQVTLIILAAVLLVKQAILIILIRHWRSLRWRFALLVWLALETTVVVIRMGGRGDAVRLLLSFAVLYDRFARPLRAKWVVAGGVALLAGFLVQGHLRGAFALNDLTPANVLTTSNEFQSLFSTAFDLYKRQQLGTLINVPWQIHWSDLYMLIPQQVLPFEKINPADWYLGIMGVHDVGVGFMFGVMSQAVLGFGWIELAIRGAVLGILLGFFHRWYVRHASNFWVTLLYLFVTIWIYYTYRATSFWILHFVVYQFIPVFVVAKLIQAGLSRRIPFLHAPEPVRAS